jgi:hypothetical protein
MNLHSAQLQSTKKIVIEIRLSNQQFWDFDSLIVGSNPAGPAIINFKKTKVFFFIHIFPSIYNK